MIIIYVVLKHISLTLTEDWAVAEKPRHAPYQSVNHSYPKVSMLRSGLCCRQSVCRLSVTLVHPTQLRQGIYQNVLCVVL